MEKSKEIDKATEKLNLPRKQMIKALKNMKVLTNFQIKNEEDGEKQTELLGTLREIENRLFTTQRNKNESSFYKFVPSSKISGNILNRSQRRQLNRN